MSGEAAVYPKVLDELAPAACHPGSAVGGHTGAVAEAKLRVTGLERAACRAPASET